MCAGGTRGAPVSKEDFSRYCLTVCSARQVVYFGRDRFKRLGMMMLFIDPENPREHGYNIPFMGNLRDECLSAYWLLSFEDAWDKIKQ